MISPLLLSKQNTEDWPKMVVEEVVRQAHQLRHEMVVMGGKIQGKPLLPLPDDGSSTALDWWVLPAPRGASKAWQGPRAAGVPLGGTGAVTPPWSLSIPLWARPPLSSRAPSGGSSQAAALAEVATSRHAGLPWGGSGPVPGQFGSSPSAGA